MNVQRYVIAGGASLVIHAALLFVSQENKVFAMPAGNPASSVSLNLVSAPPPTLEKPTPENVEPPKEPQPQKQPEPEKKIVKKQVVKKEAVKKKVVEKKPEPIKQPKKVEPTKTVAKQETQPKAEPKKKNRTGEERYGYSANCISEPIQRGNVSAYFGRQTNVCESTNAAPLSKVCAKARYRRRSLV